MKKFLLIVQGEGRGHLTQAIALTEMLEKSGNEVLATMVGISKNENLPEFFSERIKSKIITFESPALVYHPTTKNLSIGRTIAKALYNYPKYIRSIKQIQDAVVEYKPDAIINFYDVLAGIHQFVNKLFLLKPAPLICIAHQYLMLHNDFNFPPNYSRLDRFLVNFNTSLTSLFATKKLALSFREMPDFPKKSIVVVPPLLRSEVWDLSKKSNTNSDFILAYMTQPSMEKELINWHNEHKDTVVHCFSSRPQMPEVLKPNKNLYFHKINGEKFLEMMSQCRAVVSTAGFESVCEAMALSKPVMMIPLKKHFEQACNAVDAQIAGAGIVASEFNLSLLLDLKTENSKEKYSHISSWFKSSENKILPELTENQYFPVGENRYSIMEKKSKRYEFDEKELLPI